MFEIQEIRAEHALVPVITDNKRPRFSISFTSDRREHSLQSLLREKENRVCLLSVMTGASECSTRISWISNIPIPPV